MGMHDRLSANMDGFELSANACKDLNEAGVTIVSRAAAPNIKCPNRPGCGLSEPFHEPGYSG